MTFVSKVTGTNDYYGTELDKLNYIFKKITDVFKSHGFKELKTPAFEYLDLIKDSYGNECSKLIYHILDTNLDISSDLCSTNDHDIKTLSKKCLRYDLTLPLIRYVGNNLNKIDFPFKRFQIQPVWRAERPQKGRFREFYQCDADVIGSDSLLCEAELIQISNEVLKKLELKSYKIRINSRKILNDICKLLCVEDKFKRFCTSLDKIDKIGIPAFFEEIKTLNISKKNLNTLNDILINRNNIGFLNELFNQNNISSKNLDELNDLKKILANIGADLNTLTIDFSLARGLDYYTGIIYEAELTDIKIGSVIGGGRYNYFGEKFDCDKLNGVGVSFGVQRIYTAINELNLFKLKESKMGKILVTDVNNYLIKNYIEKLRVNYIVEYYYNQEDDLKTKLKFANKHNFDYVLIGEEIKNMHSGEQSLITNFIK